LLLCMIFSTHTLAAMAGPKFVVGSKRFTESYILGQIITKIAHGIGEAEVTYRPGLGSTGILFAALESGSIDLYPEYTGTIDREILKNREPSDTAALNRQLGRMSLEIAIPLGFNNTYALAMRRLQATELGIATISDLTRFSQLRFGLSQEFLGRADGWPGLKTTYGLSFVPTGLDHGLSYEAIGQEQVDVLDAYTTDAKIARYDLQVLEDDRNFFPSYDAVLLFRKDLPRRLPRTWAALERLTGQISESRMTAMNAQAELQGRSFSEIAADYVAGSIKAFGDDEESFIDLLLGPDFWRLTGQHLLLVFVSLAASTLIGIPLGIWAARRRAAKQPILALVGIVQTVPSLALLAFLIPLLHQIGVIPALIALFLYALLPIVRNTYTGLTDIDPSLRESSEALGLKGFARLYLIELPLASRAILAGVKTAAVITVGTATIAAFIGAGGYGERIVTGLALNDNTMLLAGAVPAAVLALLVQGLFDLADAWFIPEGLRTED
jgi:osmoprotectant transport system permease protein